MDRPNLFKPSAIAAAATAAAANRKRRAATSSSSDSDSDSASLNQPATSVDTHSSGGQPLPKRIKLEPGVVTATSSTSPSTSASASASVSATASASVSAAGSAPPSAPGSASTSTATSPTITPLPPPTASNTSTSQSAKNPARNLTLKIPKQERNGKSSSSSSSLDNEIRSPTHAHSDDQASPNSAPSTAAPASRAPPPALTHPPDRDRYLALTSPYTIPVDDLVRPPARGISIAMQEEAQDIVRFRAVYNDGEPESTILLTGLKNIFQKQLPKMPRDYVGKVVYDKYHASMCLYKPATLEVVGGITYKPFFDRKFIEIVFCAISSTEQVKGYGARLMNHLKDYVRTTGDLRYFLTCADNYAIGYFRKQGFTTEITLDKAIWMGYIKDYEGATVMQCTLVPRVKYLDVHETLVLQKRDLYQRIFRYSRCNVVHPGLAVFKENGGQPIDPMSIPGLAETGWTPELSRQRAKPPKSPLYILFTQLLDDMRNHADAWPFLEPVDPNHVQGYYDIIKEPMDLRTLEQNIEADRYHSLASFTHDVQKIFTNCRTFNEPTTKYFKAGIGLERYFYARKAELEKRCKDEPSPV